jgi:homopolymeric O-antigen transport system permease protein
MTSASPAATMPAGRRPGRWAGLIWTLVRTDFKTRYHGTIGGFVWALLKPLTMFVVLMGVFSFVFSNTPQYRLGLILGLFLCEFFQEGSRTGLESLRAKGYLLTKAKFPSWIVVVTSMSNAVLTLGLFSVVLIAYLTITGRAPGPLALALYLWYLLHLVVIVAGFALAASVLFMRYRDLNQVWEVITQAGFFVAPIIYPIDVLPERLHGYLYVWPPTPIILFSRSVLIDHTVPSAFAHGLLTLEAAAILCIGAGIYSVRAPRMPEYL